MTKPLIIEGDLTEDLEHRGDVVIKGNVPEGASVTVFDGKVTVEGDLDGTIGVHTDSGGISTAEDAQAYTKQYFANPEPSRNVEIHGDTGRDAQIRTPGSVRIHGDAVAGLTVESGKDFTARTIQAEDTDTAHKRPTDITAYGNIAIHHVASERFFNLRAGGDVRITGDIGNAYIKAGKNLPTGLIQKGIQITGNTGKVHLEAGFIDIGNIGPYSVIESGILVAKHIGSGSKVFTNNASVGDIGENVTVKADYLEAGNVAENSKVSAFNAFRGTQASLGTIAQNAQVNFSQGNVHIAGDVASGASVKGATVEVTGKIAPDAKIEGSHAAAERTKRSVAAETHLENGR